MTEHIPLGLDQPVDLTDTVGLEKLIQAQLGNLGKEQKGMMMGIIAKLQQQRQSADGELAPLDIGESILTHLGTMMDEEQVRALTPILDRLGNMRYLSDVSVPAMTKQLLSTGDGNPKTLIKTVMAQKPIRNNEKLSRNAPCPCGCGKKVKACPKKK